jgi:hypothetical protein
VIYAHDVHAKAGKVGRFVKGEGEEGGGHRDDIHTSEVSSDVIRAHDVHADWLEADEVHAHELNIH